MNQNRRKVHLVHAVWLHRHWRLPAGTVTDLIWSGAIHYSTPGDVWRDEQLMKRMEINHIGPKWEEGKKKGGNMHKTASFTCHGGKNTQHDIYVTEDARMWQVHVFIYMCLQLDGPKTYNRTSCCMVDSFYSRFSMVKYIHLILISRLDVDARIFHDRQHVINSDTIVVILSLSRSTGSIFQRVYTFG